MALTSQRILCSSLTRTKCARQPFRRSFVIPSTPSCPGRPHTATPRLLIVLAASKKLSSSRTGRFDSKKRRGSVSTKEEEEEEEEMEARGETEGGSLGGGGGAAEGVDDGFVMPQLPGEEPDFWEGPQWDALGFFVQYMWAFGVVFALIACGIAVVTYNEGATDFKDTPVYKESIQSRELLEEPDASRSEVFESNPTEQAPSVD